MLVSFAISQKLRLWAQVRVHHSCEPAFDFHMLLLGLSIGSQVSPVEGNPAEIGLQRRFGLEPQHHYIKTSEDNTTGG